MEKKNLINFLGLLAVQTQKILLNINNFLGQTQLPPQKKL